MRVCVLIVCALLVAQASGVFYTIECDYISDLCDVDETYSVERYINELLPSQPNDAVLFYVNLASYQGFLNFTDYVTDLQQLIVSGYTEPDFTELRSGMNLERLVLESSTFQTLDGLASVNISERLNVRQCHSFTSMSGLTNNQLTLVDLRVEECDKLADWTPLNFFSGNLGGLVVTSCNATTAIDFAGGTGVVVNGDVIVTNNNNLRRLAKITVGPSDLDQVIYRLEDLPELTTFGGFDFQHNPAEALVLWNLPKVGDFDALNFNYSYEGASYIHMLLLSNISGHVNFDGVIDKPPMYFNVLNTGIRSFDNLSYVATEPYVGGLTITGNSDLTSLAGLRGIGKNAGATEVFIKDADSLTYVHNAYFGLDDKQLFGLTVADNPSLTSLDGLQGFDNIFGELRICDNDGLTSLEGLAPLAVRDQLNYYASSTPYYSTYFPASYAGFVSICNNAALVNASLPTITVIEGSLTVAGNTALQSVRYDALTSVGGFLNVTNNGNCTNCDDVADLASIPAGGPVVIDACVVHADACPGDCANGGVCFDDPCDDTSYECDCSGTGWSGELCTVPVCGDGMSVGSEACDDGNSINGDGCENNCTLSCGNGVVDVGNGETCDDGNTLDFDGCSSTCSLECGNGFIDGAGEECDDGNTDDGDACDNNCQLNCGNGVIDPGNNETCDDGNSVGDDDCNTDCTLNCGNGVLEGTEECDDGDADDTDSCSNNCTLNCGNGVVEPHEECDDGNSEDADDCSNTCTSNCGNGVVDGTEECDDGNAIAGDGCESDCTLSCGNGVVDAEEECDDGNDIDGDGCNTDCTLNVFTGMSSSSNTTEMTEEVETTETESTKSGLQDDDDDAKKRRRNTIIGAAVGGGIGAICVCIIVGLFCAGTCSSIVAENNAAMAKTDAEQQTAENETKGEGKSEGERNADKDKKTGSTRSSHSSTSRDVESGTVTSHSSVASSSYDSSTYSYSSSS